MESFQPLANTAPDTFSKKIRFYGRMVLDLQILTIFRDVRKVVPSFRGHVLDVGCGDSPYRFLLDKARTKYAGIDIADAAKFDYANPDVVAFNGEDIPFGDNTFDGVICTEVLEHVAKYQKLTDELYRVMKNGAVGIITIPWSARYHYIPWDYFRYTPSSLKTIFGAFTEVRITPRGTDVASIASKVIVLYFRNLLPRQPVRWLLVPLWIAASPLLIFTVLIAHLALWFKLGASEDPLGYTIVIRK